MASLPIVNVTSVPVDLVAMLGLAAGDPYTVQVKRGDPVNLEEGAGANPTRDGRGLTVHPLGGRSTNRVVDRIVIEPAAGEKTWAFCDGEGSALLAVNPAE